MRANSRPPDWARSWCGSRWASRRRAISSTISPRRCAPRRRRERCSLSSMARRPLPAPVDATSTPRCRWSSSCTAPGSINAAILGHSMGSLVALETAARHSKRVTAIGLIGAAAAIPVSRDLLGAAEADDHAAIDMVRIWGYGFRAGIGGSLAPGMWMLGGAERLLEWARPGVLFKDLRACNDYRDGLASAARVTAPATLVLGERDLMTPVKAGMELAAALPNARVVVLEGAGHMLMSERPDEVLDAVREFSRGVIGG